MVYRYRKGKCLILQDGDERGNYGKGKAENMIPPHMVYLPYVVG